jgi:hypothetical protein
MTIFGENYIFHLNGSIEVHEKTEPVANYVFFVSMTINFLLTAVVNPVVLRVRLKTAARSIPSFLTCLLMATDLATNIYFPVLWGYKLLRQEEKDKSVYLLSSPYEIFNTCLLEIVSLLSVMYLAALSYLVRENIKKPLKRVSMKSVKRFAIGGTAFIVISVIVVILVSIAVRPAHSMIFSRYYQKVLDIKDGRYTITTFLVLRTTGIVCIAQWYIEVAYKLIRNKSGMDETRARREKGGRAAVAMSLAAMAGYAFEVVTYFTDRQGIQWYYNSFVMHCFIPSMLASYNSFIQVVLVKEVRKCFKGNRGEVVNPGTSTRSSNMSTTLRNNNTVSEVSTLR